MATLDDVARISLACSTRSNDSSTTRSAGPCTTRVSLGCARCGPATTRRSATRHRRARSSRSASPTSRSSAPSPRGEPEYFFVTPHFNGYPAILVKLDDIPVDRLTEAIEEAWVARAPKRLSKTWLAERGWLSAATAAPGTRHRRSGR